MLKNISLPDISHSWMQYVITQAASSNSIYGDFGQWAALAYKATGDNKYAIKSAAKLLIACSPDPADANTVREYFFDWCLWYEWIRPGIDSVTSEAIQKALNRVCEFCFAINEPVYVGGWRYTDTDQTTGQMYGLLLADRVLGTKWTERIEWIKAREAVDNYVNLSTGGEWLESSRYNLGTLKIFFTAAVMAGENVADFADEVASQLLVSLTPDFKDSVQWGDVQDARRTLLIDRWAPLLYILYNITGRKDVYEAFTKITANLPLKSWLQYSYRALYFYRSPPSTSGYLYNANGHLTYKRDDSLIRVHAPFRLSVDHEVTYPCDIQWWYKGEWILRHPLGSGAVAVSSIANNSVLFAGLSAMQDRGLREFKETSTGFTATSYTKGDYLASNYFKIPPFLNLHIRQVEYIHANKIVVLDSFDGVNPRTLPVYDKYRSSDRTAIESADALWQMTWYAVTEPKAIVNGLQWVTEFGKTMRITVPNCRYKVVPADSVLPASQFVAAERKGYLIKFLSDEPKTTVQTIIEVS